MSGKRQGWIELTESRPKPGQFVRVEVRERVESHWLEHEGQARFDLERGWLTAAGEPYLSKSQEIRRWRPLLDGTERDEWDDFVGDLARD